MSCCHCSNSQFRNSHHNRNVCTFSSYMLTTYLQFTMLAVPLTSFCSDPKIQSLPPNVGVIPSGHWTKHDVESCWVDGRNKQRKTLYPHALQLHISRHLSQNECLCIFTLNKGTRLAANHYEPATVKLCMSTSNTYCSTIQLPNETDLSRTAENYRLTRPSEQVVTGLLTAFSHTHQIINAQNAPTAPR